jgi:hypothetical protein
MLVVDSTDEVADGELEVGSLEAGSLDLATLLVAGVPHDASIIAAANDVRITVVFFFIKTFSSYF